MLFFADLVHFLLDINHDPELLEAAAKGTVNLANSTGWLAVPEEEAVEIFKKACADYKARFNL